MHGDGSSTDQIATRCTQLSPTRGGNRPYVCNREIPHISCFRCGCPNHKEDACYNIDEEAKQYKAFLVVQPRDTTYETWFPDVGVNN